MPNLCLSEIYIHGKENEIQTLYTNIKKFTSHNAKDNDFGLKWLGNVILNAGFKTIDEDKENGFECRGSIVECELTDRNSLGIFAETAYEQMNKIWLALIEKYAPNCKLHFIAYEPNNGIYEKYEDSDSKLYFNDIDYNLEINMTKSKLTETELEFIQNLEEKNGWSKKELLQQVNSFINKTNQEIISENELEDFFKNYNIKMNNLKLGSVILEKYKMLSKEEI